MKPAQGRFIAIEGLEGAGKSTALHTIKRFFTEHAQPFLTTREPGGTRVGEVVRTVIKETHQQHPLDAMTELLLIYAARVQLLQQVIRPALHEGVTVIADRFELSTFAYQGGGRHIDSKILDQLSLLCVQDTQPDLIIFLDIPPEIGLQRAHQRGKLDRIEQESLTFFHDVYEGYHQAMKKMKNVILIDATQPLLSVQQQLWDILLKHGM